jgi:hypothetical protein
MPSNYTNAELEAYLDEALAPEEMARIEQEARVTPTLVARLAGIHAARDSGAHSLGEIWRRHRLTCPTRNELGSYLLKALDDEQIEYITFHVESIGCRICRANLDDLRSQSTASPATVARRKRYFQSSAGYLKSKS